MTVRSEMRSRGMCWVTLSISSCTCWCHFAFRVTSHQGQQHDGIAWLATSARIFRDVRECHCRLPIPLAILNVVRSYVQLTHSGVVHSLQTSSHWPNCRNKYSPSACVWGVGQRPIPVPHAKEPLSKLLQWVSPPLDIDSGKRCAQ